MIYAVAKYEHYPKGVKLDGPGDEGEGVTVDEKRKKDIAAITVNGGCDDGDV